jgi:Homeodomain-like domain-containing protein
LSKARLVLTALFVDQQTPSEVAAGYGVHRGWVYRLKARYEAEGDVAVRASVAAAEDVPDGHQPGHRRPDHRASATG